MLPALRRHWPEYLMEAAGLGVFMVSAAVCAVLLEHPASPVRQAIPAAFARRALIGAAMGLTAVAIIYSPWGRRSGAHINPAVTLAFWRLGKIDGADALFYVLAQFAGGIAGIAATRPFLGGFLADPSVRFVVTVPGAAGTAVALLCEAAISLGLMAAVLVSSNHPRASRLTGFVAGLLVALYIAFEAPLSGMSMNPARTVASAAHAGVWTAAWIYFLAPVSGMLAAAELYRLRAGAAAVLCAKLHHGGGPCIFRCRYADLSSAPGRAYHRGARRGDLSSGEVH